MSVNARIRVLLVDDEEFNRLRLRDLLDAESDVDIVGEAADGWRRWSRSVPCAPISSSLISGCPGSQVSTWCVRWGRPDAGHGVCDGV